MQQELATPLMSLETASLQDNLEKKFMYLWEWYITIMHTSFNVISWMKMFEFGLIFHYGVTKPQWDDTIFFFLFQEL